MGNANTRKNRKYRRKLRRYIMTFLAMEQNLRFRDTIGCRCEYCFVEDGRVVKRDLEFDHHSGNRGWRWDEHGELRRLDKMRRDALDGKLKLSCRHHNSKRWREHRDSQSPF